MTTRVKRWGNSLAVRIPTALAAEVPIREDTEIEIHAESGSITIRPAAPRKRAKYRLDQLVSQITEENRHEEVSVGGIVGNEVW